MSYQDATGYWQTLRLWFEFPTALAVEYLPSKDERGVLPNEYLLSSRRLIAKSEQLCISGGASDAQLAVVAACHGVEHFLYGMMLQDQKAEFHREGKTIGFRAAIVASETMVKRLNIIGQSEGFPYKTSLMQMAQERDAYIHQSPYISIPNAERNVQSVRNFVKFFDVSILGSPLLD